MQAGGDVLGGCLTAKHVALEHLGQFITSYVGKVPVEGGAPQCLPVPSNMRRHPYPTRTLPPGPSQLLRASGLGMVSRGCCLLAGG